MEADVNKVDGVANKKRFAAVNEEQLHEIVQNKDAKNTKRSTDSAVRLFRKYLGEKDQPLEFESYDAKTLDNILGKFYAEARTEDGSLYKKSSLQTIRHGINRHLSLTREVDIINGKDFKESKKIFLAVCKDLKRQGYGGVSHYPPIEEADLHKMYQMFDLNNPKTLQWRIFCDIMLYFGRRGRENIRELKISDFAVTTDGEGYKYIYIVRDELTKNHQDDSNSASGRMYEDRDSDDLCPVRTFVRYKKRLNPKCVFLFQRPSLCPKTNIWYDAAPVGPNQLGSMMSDISKAYKLSHIYTNHSLRATTVHILDEAQIPGRHIMTVTGHKSETSLKSYTGYTSTKTKKKMSATVTESLTPAVCFESGNKKVLKSIENKVNVNSELQLESAFNPNEDEIVSLTSSQVDYLDQIVTDMDNDSEFDDVLHTLDVHTSSSPAKFELTGNRSSNVVPVRTQNNTLNYSCNSVLPKFPVIYNYGSLTINYTGTCLPQSDSNKQ